MAGLPFLHSRQLPGHFSLKFFVQGLETGCFDEALEGWMAHDKILPKRDYDPLIKLLELLVFQYIHMPHIKSTFFSLISHLFIISEILVN